MLKNLKFPHVNVFLLTLIDYSAYLFAAARKCKLPGLALLFLLCFPLNGQSAQETDPANPTHAVVSVMHEEPALPHVHAPSIPKRIHTCAMDYWENLTHKTKAFCAAVFAVSAVTLFAFSLGYYTYIQETERSRFDVNKPFGEIAQGIRKYGWCNDVPFYTANRKEQAFLCLIHALVPTSIMNAWGSNTTATALHFAPLQTAFQRTGLSDVYGHAYVDPQSGQITAISTGDEGAWWCKSVDCVRFHLTANGEAKFRRNTALDAAMTLWADNQSSSTPTARQLLQQTPPENPLEVMEHQVANDANLHNQLVSLYRAYAKNQCPDSGPLGEYLAEAYASIFDYTDDNTPYMTVSFWYQRAARGNITVTHVNAQFTSQAPPEGPSGCDFSSNRALANNSHASVTLTEDGLIDLLVSQHVQDMLGPRTLTFEPTVTKTPQLSQTQTHAHKKNRTVTPAVAGDGDVKTILWVDRIKNTIMGGYVGPNSTEPYGVREVDGPITKELHKTANVIKYEDIHFDPSSALLYFLVQKSYSSNILSPGQVEFNSTHLNATGNALFGSIGIIEFGERKRGGLFVFTNHQHGTCILSYPGSWVQTLPCILSYLFGADIAHVNENLRVYSAAASPPQYPSGVAVHLAGYLYSCFVNTTTNLPGPLQAAIINVTSPRTISPFQFNLGYNCYNVRIVGDTTIYWSNDVGVYRGNIDPTYPVNITHAQLWMKAPSASYGGFTVF